jgi:hypothetical protein
MKSLMLFCYLLTGRVEQNGPLYNIHIDESNQYDWVYNVCRGELFNWLETGTFEYDDNLCNCGELEFYTATEN